MARGAGGSAERSDATAGNRLSPLAHEVAVLEPARSNWRVMESPSSTRMKEISSSDPIRRDAVATSVVSRHPTCGSSMTASIRASGRSSARIRKSIWYIEKNTRRSSSMSTAGIPLTTTSPSPSRSRHAAFALRSSHAPSRVQAASRAKYSIDTTPLTATKTNAPASIPACCFALRRGRSPSSRWRLNGWTVEAFRCARNVPSLTLQNQPRQTTDTAAAPSAARQSPRAQLPLHPRPQRDAQRDLHHVRLDEHRQRIERPIPRRTPATSVSSGSPPRNPRGLINHLRFHRPKGLTPTNQTA